MMAERSTAPRAELEAALRAIDPEAMATADCFWHMFTGPDAEGRLERG